jgi:multiple sugar transport system permease protein
MASGALVGRPPGIARRRLKPYAYILPGFVYIVATTIVPLGYSLRSSLMADRATSAREPHFIGLENYLSILQAPEFWHSMRVTLVFTVATVGLELMIGTACALLLNRLRRGRKLSRVLLVIPFSLPPVVVGLMYLLILDRGNGILNYVIGLLGIPPQSWLGDAHLALGSIIAVDMWQWTPFVIISALAALETMPGDVLEAARMDGASGWQLLRWVILPLIKPVLLVIALTRALTSLKVFDLIFVLTNGGPGRSTETLSYGVYVDAFQRLDFGHSAALSWLLIAVAMVLSVPLVRSVLKASEL